MGFGTVASFNGSSYNQDTIKYPQNNTKFNLILIDKLLRIQMEKKTVFSKHIFIKQFLGYRSSWTEFSLFEKITHANLHLKEYDEFKPVLY